MKSATLREIKTELSILHPNRLQEICLQMAKFRKENKELLTYLLFESEDEIAYTRAVKSAMEEQFSEVNRNNVYLAKKTIRKILLFTNKQVRFSGSKQTEVELLIHFCKLLRKTGYPLPFNTILGRIYFRQFQRIQKSLATLHEDLQFDYAEEMKLLK